MGKVAEDKRIETHIPYIGKNRTPIHCFGEKTCLTGCDPPTREACKAKNYGIIEWFPIIGRVSKKLK